MSKYPEYCHEKSRAWFDRALKVIPSGIYGHLGPSEGLFLPLEKWPLISSKAKGTYFWDMDGNRYLDLMCAYGPNVLGYGDPDVDRAALEQLMAGNCTTAPSYKMVECAELLTDTVACADWAFFMKNGTDATTFNPDGICTRAQIVTFLWRAAGSPESKSMSSFSDVSADSYYAKAVAWAVEKGITSGTGDRKFNPKDPCTRAQSVTFLYRAAGSPAVIGSAEFSDVASDTYYAAAVAWAAKNGITSGTGGGQFGSDNKCTRGHIVTFLFSAYGK